MAKQLIFIVINSISVKNMGVQFFRPTLYRFGLLSLTSSTCKQWNDIDTDTHTHTHTAITATAA